TPDKAKVWLRELSCDCNTPQIEQRILPAIFFQLLEKQLEVRLLARQESCLPRKLLRAPASNYTPTLLDRRLTTGLSTRPPLPENDHRKDIVLCDVRD